MAINLTTLMKRRLEDIALIVMSVVILVGSGLTMYMLARDKTVIEVDLTPGETQEIQFEKLGLCPGESCDYTLRLGSEYTETYQVTLSFREREATNALKQYTYVRVTSGEQVLCDLRLDEAFETDTLSLTVDLSDGGKQELQVTYYMPAEVGNEAQDAEVELDLLITAENE